jgi:hypothetical protein
MLPCNHFDARVEVDGVRCPEFKVSVSVKNERQLYDATSFPLTERYYLFLIKLVLIYVSTKDSRSQMLKRATTPRRAQLRLENRWYLDSERHC